MKIDSDTEVDTVLEDLQDILKEYADDVEVVGEPEKIEVDGLPGLLIVGTGHDTEADKGVAFIAFVIVRGEEAAIVYFQLDEDMNAAELQEVQVDS